jgi:uncharacterized protein
VEVLKPAVRLRVIVAEAERFQGKPLYAAIVRKARETHLAGATVMRGVMGFGRSRRINTANFLETAQNLPLIIEIVDTREKVEAFLPVLRELMRDGLVTIGELDVVEWDSTVVEARSIIGA